MAMLNECVSKISISSKCSCDLLNAFTKHNRGLSHAIIIPIKNKPKLIKKEPKNE